jgi:glycosyltransferase involved in cell wall biosynthesis
VLARNEEANIARALESLPDEVRAIVVDDESDDATADVARGFGAIVITRALADFVSARRFGASRVRTPWTLMIDADEALDSAAAAAIVNAGEDVDGYALQRTTFYRGKALRLWRNERLLRLFKTGRARVEARPPSGGSAQLHERWICDGRVDLLDGRLLHYSYATAREYHERFERYTAMEAAGLAPSWSRLAAEAVRTPLRFAWYALGRGAVLDGADGVAVAWHSARYPFAVARKALR